MPDVTLTPEEVEMLEAWRANGSHPLELFQSGADSDDDDDLDDDDDGDDGDDCCPECGAGPDEDCSPDCDYFEDDEEDDDDDDAFV